MKTEYVDPILNFRPIIEVLRTDQTVDIPRYATQGSAGMDLQAAIANAIVLLPGESAMIPTGLRMHIGDPRIAAMILPRSGKGARDGLVVGNLVGLIDSDYQGELIVCAWNRNFDLPLRINPLDKIAQLVFVPVWQVALQVVAEFTQETARGMGGFGSTDATSQV